RCAPLAPLRPAALLRAPCPRDRARTAPLRSVRHGGPRAPVATDRDPRQGRLPPAPFGVPVREWSRREQSAGARRRGSWRAGRSPPRPAPREAPRRPPAAGPAESTAAAATVRLCAARFGGSLAANTTGFDGGVAPDNGGASAAGAGSCAGAGGTGVASVGGIGLGALRTTCAMECVGVAGSGRGGPWGTDPALSTRNATPATTLTTPGIAKGLDSVATSAAALDTALAVLVVATAAPTATARRRTERWTRARASEGSEASPRLAASIKARAPG